MKHRIKNYINNTLEKFTGMRIENTAIHGRQDWRDIKNSGRPINTVIDVGANIGQSALKFHHAFPQAQIYCFEPVDHLYRKLEKNIGHLDNIHTFPDALGASPGESTIYLTHHETTSSLIKPDYVKQTQSVRVTTLDEFLQAENITRADLVKIDVEGLDLEVLRGGAKSLEQRKVQFILVECGFYDDIPNIVCIDKVRDYLYRYGFRLFGIYDQQPAWSGTPGLHYVNACFILA